MNSINMSTSHRQTASFAALCLALLLLLAGCDDFAIPTVEPTPTPESANPGIVEQGRLRTDISGLNLDQSLEEQVTSVSATVITEGARANVRSGPGLGFPIIAKGEPGTVYDVLGRSEDGEWYQICCVNPAGEVVRADEEVETEEGAATLDQPVNEQIQPAWLSQSVVQLSDSVSNLPTQDSVFTSDLSASWAVDWSCESERCEPKECSAIIAAVTASGPADQWLQVDHEVEWDESCFSTDSWSFEVNRFTGQERNASIEDNFLYSYWLGPNPGSVNSVFVLEDGREIGVWCSGPYEVPLEESGGWTTIYEGNTCHDVRTGMMIYISYIKRWIFSGEYEGQQYDRMFFGDFERLEQSLIDTNADLYFVNEGTASSQ